MHKQYKRDRSLEQNGVSPVVQAELAHRLHVAGSVVSRLYLASPDENLRDNLFSDHMLDTWPLDDAHSARGVELLREAERSDAMEDLNRDHLALFEGAGRPLVQPFESPYVAQDGRVLQETTLEVRQAYANEGFVVPEGDRLPEDHVGYEIAFAAALCGKLSVAAEADEAEAVRITANQLEMFGVQHLKRFVFPIIDGLRARANTSIYQALADLTQGFVQGVDELLKSAR